MSEADDLAPASRTRDQLLTLIEQSACAEPAFNPWPLAELDARLTELTAQPPSENNEFAEWQRLQSEYAAAGGAWHGSIIHSPRLQREAARRCIDLKRSIENGDGFSVVEAVAVCATHGLVIPGWLAAEFVLRYQRVATGDCRSWSDEQAFGSALEKGANVAGLKAKAQTAPWAYEVATRLLVENPLRPIDRALFEEVGKEVGAGQTKVQALIAGYLEKLDAVHPPLVYVKGALQSGCDLSAVRAKWEDEQHEAFLRSIGLVPGVDDVWRKSVGHE